MLKQAMGIYVVDFANKLSGLQEEVSMCLYPQIHFFIIPLLKNENKQKNTWDTVQCLKAEINVKTSLLLHRIFLCNPRLAQPWGWMFPLQKVQSYSPELSSQKQLK